LATVITIVKLL